MQSRRGWHIHPVKRAGHGFTVSLCSALGASSSLVGLSSRGYELGGLAPTPSGKAEQEGRANDGEAQNKL